MNRYDAYAVAAIAVAAVACLTQLGGGVGMGEHECLVAETAREMRASGQWIVPTFAGEPRVRKSPPAYWCVAALSLLTGVVDEFTSRLPSALSALGIVACAWRIARRIGGPRTGAVAAWVAGTSTGLAFYSHQAVVDLQQAFWCALCYCVFFAWETQHGLRPQSFCGTGVPPVSPTGETPVPQDRRLPRALAGFVVPCGERRSRWAAYLFWVVLGVALLAKFPVAGVVVVAPLGVCAAIQLATRRWTWRDAWALRPIEGIALLLVVVAPWFIAVWQRVPGYVAVWKSETLDRFSGELRSDESRWLSQPWYYLPVLAVFCLPWSLSLPQALAAPFRGGDAARRRSLLLIWLWLVVTFSVMTVMGFKRSHYLLPALPAACVLLGFAVEEFFFGAGRVRPDRTRLGAAAVVLAGALAAAGSIFVVKAEAPEMLPVIRYAAPLMFAGILVAVGLYVTHRRAESLVVIGAMATGLFMMVWPVLGAERNLRVSAMELRALIDRHVPAGQEVRWVGRQSAQLVFYGPLPYARLEDPRRYLAASRATSQPKDVAEWVADQLSDRLRSERPIWLVLAEDDFSLFHKYYDAPASIVGTVRPPAATTLKAMVLVTNARSGRSPS